MPTIEIYPAVHVKAKGTARTPIPLPRHSVGNRIGLDAIADVGAKLGLGAPTGIPIPGESPGVMPTADWHREHGGSRAVLP